MQPSSAVSHRYEQRNNALGAKHVTACVDRSKHAQKIVLHAFAIANALRIPVSLLQVLKTPMSSDLRPDPIERDIERHKARNALKSLAEARPDGVEVIDEEVVEGYTVEEICRCTQKRSTELIVLGTHGEREPGEYGIGSTARNVLEKAAGSVLLVPVHTTPARVPSYRRLLVPLDGSSWSESVLPLAARLARAADAELILVYVIPVPELIETDPLEAEDLELRERLIARNERVARSYLDRIRGYAAEQGLKVRALTRRGDDIRSSLITLINTEHVDLVVFSARGHGGLRVSDVPYGNVAGYLITHSPVPMLIVRPTGSPSIIPTSAAKHEAGRQPARPVA